MIALSSTTSETHMPIHSDHEAAENAESCSGVAQHDCDKIM
jgi:hypothetical protein